MRFWLWKLRVLVLLLRGAYEQWRTDVAPYSPDQPYCCDGGTSSLDICGCGGMTLREVYKP